LLWQGWVIVTEFSIPGSLEYKTHFQDGWTRDLKKRLSSMPFPIKTLSYEYIHKTTVCLAFTGNKIQHYVYEQL